MWQNSITFISSAPRGKGILSYSRAGDSIGVGGTSTMFKHEWYRFVILRHAKNGHVTCERLGWPTTWGTLGQFIRQAGLDESGRESMDALMWLQERKLIALKKTFPNGNGYLTYDYDEYDKQRFFWGDFSIYVTSEGSAYFNELETKAYAAKQAASPASKQNSIGFHA